MIKRLSLLLATMFVLSMMVAAPVFASGNGDWDNNNDNNGCFVHHDNNGDDGANGNHDDDDFDNDGRSNDRDHDDDNDGKKDHKDHDGDCEGDDWDD